MSEMTGMTEIPGFAKMLFLWVAPPIYISIYRDSRLLPQRLDIENLRPKSPKSWSGGRGRGRGGSSMRGTRTRSRGAFRGASH